MAGFLVESFRRPAACKVAYDLGDILQLTLVQLLEIIRYRSYLLRIFEISIKKFLRGYVQVLTDVEKTSQRRQGLAGFDIVYISGVLTYIKAHAPCCESTVFSQGHQSFFKHIFINDIHITCTSNFDNYSINNNAAYNTTVASFILQKLEIDYVILT